MSLSPDLTFIQSLSCPSREKVLMKAPWLFWEAALPLSHQFYPRLLIGKEILQPGSVHWEKTLSHADKQGDKLSSDES